MRLLIETQNECMLLDVTNIVVIKNVRQGIKSPCIEISCTNHDTYRISCSQTSVKSVERFVSYCAKSVNTFYNAQRSGNHSFALSFEEYDTNFEKNSFNGCID